MSEEVESKKITFSGLLKHLPQLSILVILLSLYKQILYYTGFNISIKYFTGISELGLLIADDLSFTLLVIGYLAISSDFFKYNLNPYNNATFKKKESKPHIYLLIIIFISLMLVPFLTSITLAYISYRLKLFCWSMSIIVIVLVVHFLNRSKIADFSSSLYAPVQILLVTISTLTYLTYLDISKLERGNYEGTTIKTEDSTYVSNRESYFVGKTEKYVFHL